MSFHKYLIYAAVAFAVAGAAPIPAAAGTITYQYAGNSYDTFTGASLVGSGDHMTINIQLDGSVTDGTVYSTAWLSWSISAGALSVSSAAGDSVLGIESLWGGTDAPAYIHFNGGSVDSWDILGAVLSTPPVLFLSVYDLPALHFNEGVGPVGNAWSASVSTAGPGTWSVLPDGGGAVATPEPGTLGMLACSTLLLLFRRKNRTA